MSFKIKALRYRGAFFMPERGEQMQVSSTITINTANIGMLTELGKQAQIMTAEAMHTKVVQAQVVPRDTGLLQGEAFFVDTSRIDSGVVSLVHSTPYARRLYFHPEYNFHREEWFDSKGGKHEGNSNAQGLWLDDWISGSEKDFCPRTFMLIYRNLLRGVR